MKKALLIVCAVVCSFGVSFAQFKPKPFELKVKYRGEVNIGGAFSTNLHIPPQADYSGFHMKVKSSLSRPLIETVHGVMISDYIFVGAGLGLQYYAGKVGEPICYQIDRDEVGEDLTWGALAIPMFVNLKGFFPINDDIRPFLNLSFGGTVVACSNATFEEKGGGYIQQNKHHGGFYCDFGAGVEYKRWNFGIGLQHQRMSISEEYSYVDGPSDGPDKAKGYFNSFYIKVGMNF